MELDLNLFYLVTRRHCAFKFPTFMILYGTLGLRSLVKNRTKKWWLFHRFVLTITWLDKCASFSSVQSLSRVQLFVTPWTAAHKISLSITNSWTLLKLMFIESVMPSNHLFSVSPFSPTFKLSQHEGLFQWPSSSHQVAKVLEFQLHHQSFQWIFRTDFL